MKIIKYENSYRDDMIFMVLQAKDAIGKKPTINEDLFDVEANYINRGDMFWLAIDDNDRVVGCVGYSKIENMPEAFLHRLFVKASEKRKGIGTQLLNTAECEMRRKGITIARVHLGHKKQWYESYKFYPKHGYEEYEERYMKKEL